MNTIILVTILNILLWVGSITAYVVWNLNRKNKILEDSIIKYNSFIDNLSGIIKNSNEIINNAEVAGSFKADDEIGYFFKSLKEIQDELNYFMASTEK